MKESMKNEKYIQKICLYFWLHRVFITVCGLSLAVESGDCLQVAVQGLLSLVASLVERRLWARRPQWLLPVGSVIVACGLQSPGVLAHRLSCPAACGIFPGQGLSPCPLYCMVNS